VVVARDAEGFGDALVLDCRLQHHAVAKLADHAALDFLPGGLGRGELVAALGFQRLATLDDLGIGNQDVGPALLQVDAYSVAAAQDAQVAAASGDALRIEGEAEVPDWRPSPMQASAVTPFLIR
jgi:hypothetical protein